MGANVGNNVTILTESDRFMQFKVVGIFNSESSIYNADTIVMNINDARSFFDVPEGQVTDLLVYVSNVDAAHKSSLVNYVARSISSHPTFGL